MGILGRQAPWAGLLLLLSACEAGPGLAVVTPGAGAGLRTGEYTYRAWSDFSDLGPAWWGFLAIRVGADGVISGRYLLPRQCADAFGIEADCFGVVGGRLLRDGTVRFGFDEGWLGHQGEVHPRSRVSGVWDARVLGYRDSGTFELVLQP